MLQSNPLESNIKKRIEKIRARVRGKKQITNHSRKPYELT